MILAVASGVVPVSAQVNCNPGVEFYDEGPLKRCNLNGNHRLYTDRGDVVVCADGHPLVQFLDGRLQSCTLAEPSVIAGARCEAMARVEFDADGNLRSCREN
jgi:hypothetical protein